MSKKTFDLAYQSVVSCYIFKSLEVREIVKHFLSQNGFDGLVDCYGECGCDLDDLMRCNCSCIECLAAYKRQVNRFVETDKSWRMVQARDSDIEGWPWKLY